MSSGKEHGALGSNKPLERVPVEDEDVPAENQKEETTLEVLVATSSATKKDDEDVVYLREELKPSAASSRSQG